MKKLYLFVTLMVLAASSSMTAVAQHYVKIKNTTTSINGIQYEIGDIPNEEVDTATALYIHILNLDGSQINTNRGIEKGAKFKVENFDNNIKKVKFYDKKGDKLRFDCFKEAEVLIKVKDDFIRYNDVNLLDAEGVKTESNSLRDKIKFECSYDTSTKTLDCTSCSYEYKINSNKFSNGLKHEKIEPNTQIIFLTTKDEVPNIVLSANDLVKEVVQEVNQSGGILNWLKENWMMIVGGVVVIVIAVFLVFWLLNKKQPKKETNDYSSQMTKDMKKQNHKNDKKHKNKDFHKQMMGELDNHNKDEKEEIKTSVIDERLFHKLTTLIERVDSTQSSIREQSITLDRIKSLVENTDEKKELAQKIQELEDEKKKSASVDEKLKEAHANIEDLKEQIEQLQAASQIEGAVQVTEYSTFVSFAKKILSECIDADIFVFRSPKQPKTTRNNQT